MLYIDEPNQVELSYDTPTNVTIYSGGDGLRLYLPISLTGSLSSTSPPELGRLPALPIPPSRLLMLYGTLSRPSSPSSHTTDDRISMWAESYGGHHGPGSMHFFQQQN
ncbi:hypothetical protein EsDP_00002183 [Epichloe bromicola]|uniref:Uncharacterized protein n=1 Tax=Epichloe bromicola TaxID=79588 RepID=A0ABQ0CK09_9HYPO